jgi:hypothetical protein
MLLMELVLSFDGIDCIYIFNILIFFIRPWVNQPRIGGLEALVNCFF